MSQSNNFAKAKIHRWFVFTLLNFCWLFKYKKGIFICAFAYNIFREVNPSSNQIRTACVCQHSSLGSGETIQRHYRDWFTPTVRTGRIGLIWKQQRKASVVGYSSLLAVFVLGCFFIRSLAFQPQFDYIELFNILEKTFLFTTFINLCQEIQYSIFVLIVFNTFENLVTIHATCERGITTLLGITGRECLGMDSCLEWVVNQCQRLHNQSGDYRRSEIHVSIDWNCERRFYRSLGKCQLGKQANGSATCMKLSQWISVPR